MAAERAAKAAAAAVVPGKLVFHKKTRKTKVARPKPESSDEEQSQMDTNEEAESISVHSETENNAYVSSLVHSDNDDDVFMKDNKN